MPTATELLSMTDNTYLVLDDRPVRVLESHRLEDSPDIRVHVHDLYTGAQADRIIPADHDLPLAEVELGTCTWSFGSDQEQTFLCSETHKQFSLRNLNGQSRYLTRYVDYRSVRLDDEFIAVELPQTVDALVIGIHQENGQRLADTELGAVIAVPPEVDLGDTIAVAPYAEIFISKRG